MRVSIFLLAFCAVDILAKHWQTPKLKNEDTLLFILVAAFFICLAQDLKELCK